MTLRVVVVDDEPDLRWLASHYLVEAGFGVETWDRVSDDLLELSAWDGVGAAVVDGRIPFRPGAVLLEWLADNAPHVRRVLCTASVHDAVRDTRAHVILLKPYSPEQLVEAVRGTG